ncbi:MAG: hypothetical protein QOI61_95 [Actinomycetota bacterium]
MLSTTATSRAQQAEGTIGIGLVDAPTNRADDPRAKLYIVDHLAPGTTITRRVKVSNDTDQTQSIDTYAGAASVEDGQFQFGDAHAVNELTTWTSVDPTTDTYEAGKSKNVRVTIAVPDDASEGERYAVIWASTSTAAPQGGGIGAVNRVGIRVYLSVGPGGEPASDFEITGIQAKRTKDGAPQVVAIVENTGGRAIDLSGALKLDNGPGGLSAGPFNVTLGTTLEVGGTEPVRVDLDKALPAGPWDAKLTLKSGLLERSANAEITFPKSGSAEIVRPTSSSGRGVIAIAVLVAVAAAIALLFYVRRRRDREETVSE